MSQSKQSRHYVIYRNGSYCFSATNVQAVYHTLSNSEKELQLKDLHSYSKFLRTLRANNQVTVITHADQKYVIAVQPLYRSAVPLSELLKYA